MLNIKYLVPRITFWLFRFKTLDRVKRIFGSVKAPCFLSRSLFNFDFYVDVSRGATQQLLYLEGERLIYERFLIGDLLKKGMRIVDVGANIGYYLLMFERSVGDEGEVICIEPSVENLPELRKNIEMNRFSNVKLFEVAVGMEEGKTEMYEGINSGIAESGKGAYEVGLKRLDSIVNGKVDFLKIDVEGYEGQVIKGSMNLIGRQRPVLFLELHPHIVIRYGFSIKSILDELSQYYKEITLYEYFRPEKTGFLTKTAFRYFGLNPVVRIKDVENYINTYNSGTIIHTFWAVCLDVK